MVTRIAVTNLSEKIGVQITTWYENSRKFLTFKA
jgi:hypothetical protein